MRNPPPSFDPLKERLRELYGVKFPDGLFLLHEFLRTYPEGEKEKALDALRIHPTGVLQVLGRLAAGRDVSSSQPLLLHYRFYRDPPEFFTCLHGDTDGLHWGLLWDEPALGFRGAASYYNNDGDTIEVYRSLFDALIDRIDDRIESTEEMIEEDPEHEPEYREDAAVAGRMRERLREFVDRHGVRLDEDRPDGVESDTGLGLVVPDEYHADEGGGTPESPEHWQALSSDGIAELISECEAGRVVPAMAAGRSLWYWGGDGHSAAAYRLLQAAYAALERPELLRVLDLHYQHRDMKSVDLLAK